MNNAAADNANRIASFLQENFTVHHERSDSFDAHLQDGRVFRFHRNDNVLKFAMLTADRSRTVMFEFSFSDDIPAPILANAVRAAANFTGGAE